MGDSRAFHLKMMIRPSLLCVTFLLANATVKSAAQPNGGAVLVEGKLGDRYGFHSDHGASYLGMTSYGSADWRCHCYSPSSSSPPTTRRTVGVFSGVCGHAWRDDLRCGEDNSSPPKIFLAPNGETAQCDPNGEAPC